MSFFTDPLAFEFMRQALIMAIVVAVPCALLSCYLVLKGWALMGDAVSHAVLPGIVLAYITGLPLLIGAFAAGLFCAVATGFISDNSRVKQDTVMGVVLSGMIALGLVLYVALGVTADLQHILIGNMLGVDRAELINALANSVIVSLGLLVFWRDLMLHAFDPAQAKASGLATGWLHYGLLTALSLTIVAVLSATGLILAIGHLIAPGAIAFLLVRNLAAMLAVSVLVCALSMFLGVYLSFFIDSAPAPTIILVLTVNFIGVLSHRLWRNRREESRAL